MVNIFFVAWEFPPLTVGGVHRSMYFVKYLREFGINPIVITVPIANGSLGREDYSLMDVIPDDIQVERIECNFKNHSYANKLTEWADYYFSLVEKHGEAWRAAIYKALPGLINKYQPQAIYVTIPPFSMATLWTGIAKKYKLPLLLDFRDAWSQWITRPYGSWLHYKALLHLEKNCIKKADAIVCTSQQIATDLMRIHPRLKEDKITIITNGFDRPISDWQGQREKAGKERFVIGYVGSFYYSPESMQNMFKPWWKKKVHRIPQYTPRYENWLYRSPYFFFKAMAAFLKLNPTCREQITIKFAGDKPNWIDSQIDEFELRDICEFSGFLDYDKVIGFQEECDALLITSSKVLGGRDYSIAGKTFDYFTMGRPVLAFVCEGAQKDILEHSGICVICDPDNTEAAIIKLKSFFEGEIKLKPDLNYLELFKRKHLTEKLAKIMHKIAGINHK